MPTSTKEPVVYRQPTEEQRDQMIDAVISAFDFDKVHRVMVYLDWKWVTETGALEVPDIHRLKACSRRLMREAYRMQQKHGTEVGVVGSGGFRAQYFWADEKGDADIHLSFLVEEQNSYDYYQPNYPE